MEHLFHVDRWTLSFKWQFNDYVLLFGINLCVCVCVCVCVTIKMLYSVIIPNSPGYGGV